MLPELSRSITNGTSAPAFYSGGACAENSEVIHPEPHEQNDSLGKLLIINNVYPAFEEFLLAGDTFNEL